MISIQRYCCTSTADCICGTSTSKSQELNLMFSPGYWKMDGICHCHPARPDPSKRLLANASRRRDFTSFAMVEPISSAMQYLPNRCLLLRTLPPVRAVPKHLQLQDAKRPLNGASVQTLFGDVGKQVRRGIVSVGS